MAKSYLDKMRGILKKAEDAQRKADEAQQVIDKIEAKSDRILNLIGEAYGVLDDADVDAIILEIEGIIQHKIDESFALKMYEPKSENNVSDAAVTSANFVSQNSEQVAANPAATSQQIQ